MLILKWSSFSSCTICICMNLLLVDLMFFKRLVITGDTVLWHAFICRWGWRMLIISHFISVACFSMAGFHIAVEPTYNWDSGSDHSSASHICFIQNTNINITKHYVKTEVKAMIRNRYNYLIPPIQDSIGGKKRNIKHFNVIKTSQDASQKDSKFPTIWNLW